MKHRIVIYCVFVLIFSCLSITYAFSLSTIIDFSNLPEDDAPNQPFCVFFYNPGNPSIYHSDLSCQAYGSKYSPFIKITDSYPLFSFMHPCSNCVETTNITTSSTHPSLWSMEKKAENMPDIYSVPTNQEASLFQIVQSAIEFVIKYGDDPSQYACYVSHLRLAEDTGQYIVFFASPYRTADGTVFQNIRYEIQCSPISGKVLSCDILTQANECTN